MWSLYTHSRAAEPEELKRASALNNLIFVGDINRLHLARSEDTARSILMNFSLKPNIDCRVFTESALAGHVSCGFTSCPVQFEGVFTTDWIGLLSIAFNKVSAAIYRLWQPWTACYIFHIITCKEGGG